MLKHSRATEVFISINCEKVNDGEYVHLLIKDNGIGLEIENINPGLGLLGMRERGDMLGGQFQLSSSRNNGLTIDIEIPLTN